MKIKIRFFFNFTLIFSLSIIKYILNLNFRLWFLKIAIKRKNSFLVFHTPLGLLCKGLSHTLGDHLILRGIRGERIARDNYVRDALFQIAVSLVVSRERGWLISSRDAVFGLMRERTDSLRSILQYFVVAVIFCLFYIFAFVRSEL